MSRRKFLLMLLAALIFMAAAGFGMGFHLAHYTMIDGHLYFREAQVLDLKGKDISLSHYQKLREAIPQADIRWDIPIGSQRFPQDARKVTLTELTAEDLPAFACFTQLELVSARGCREYDLLYQLQKQYPELEVVYTVQIGKVSYELNAVSVDVSGLQAEEISRLDCLPRLQQVVCASGGGDLQALQLYCQQRGLPFLLQIAGQMLSSDAVAVHLTGVTEAELPLLRLLPQLMNLHLSEPMASPESLIVLQQAMPQTYMTWDKTICGIPCPSDAQELNLSQADSVSLEEIARLIGYIPNAHTVFLGGRNTNYDELAALREQMRDAFKLVWLVPIGQGLRLRTDATMFIPAKHNVYYLDDEDAYNLRYCEDMIYLDLSRLTIRDLDFLNFMPNLTYLDLANTQVSDITPLGSCKQLKLLELDGAPVRDVSPLVGCTALEDANLGSLYGDLTPVAQMTWLKNLWVIHCNHGVAYQLREAMPGTRVQGSGGATKESGWRELPNYLAMEQLRQNYRTTLT